MQLFYKKFLPNSSKHQRNLPEIQDEYDIFRF